MRRLETVCVAAALVLLVVGLSVRLLTIPTFTSVVARVVDSPTRTGLAEETTLDLADQVRRYVIGADPGPLPGEVSGRAGFDASAVSHLDDVRAVLMGAWRATWVLLVGFGIWLAWRIYAGRQEVVVRVIRGGGWSAIVLVPLAAVVALGDFEGFFTAFHGLFFESGTWEFPTGDLLIELFPEPFWMIGAAALGALILFGGGVLVGTSRVLRVQKRKGAPAGDG